MQRRLCGGYLSILALIINNTISSTKHGITAISSRSEEKRVISKPFFGKIFTITASILIHVIRVPLGSTRIIRFLIHFDGADIFMYTFFTVHVEEHGTAIV
jgi:hypothetical protein